MGGMKGGKHHKYHQGARLGRTKQEDEEVKELERIIEEGAPAPGTNPLAADIKADGATGYSGLRKFSDMPLSNYTKKSLKESKFIDMTAIQRATLPHALCGRDVLGAAKTGSGKTLSFLIPIIETLFRERWSGSDGLGALVISPTRELAVQIFDELKKAGKHHNFSAGLLIGGKNVNEERSRIYAMNILICTPGRLLQHMDETPNFDCTQIKVLVLDEADRCLDMGFSETMNAILENLPTERQTLLFSATQTKSIKDLARMSLVDPEYISVHAEAAQSTPQRLQQSYTVCELHEKNDVMWSFIKAHLKCKVLIFLSTCKQVQYMHEAFRKLRPGVPLRLLHGKMKQQKRMTVFQEFCEAEAMVLFATDVAARGLDFPSVEWVVQGDCPEDTASYIHRVGRTARYTASGRALLLLLPSELAFVDEMEAAKIPVKQIKVDPRKRQPVQGSLQALLSKEIEIKHAAQKALVAYMRSVFLQPNKKVFDVHKLPAEDYAHSLGLPNPPKLRFVSKDQSAKNKAAAVKEEKEAAKEARRRAAAGAAGARGGGGSGSEDEDEDGEEGAGSSDEDEEAEEAGKKKLVERKIPRLERIFTKRNRNVLSEEYQQLRETVVEDDDGDDLMVVKRKNHQLDEGGEGGEGGEAVIMPLSFQAPKPKKLKIRGTAVDAQNRKVFDDEGNALAPLAALARNGFGGVQEGDLDVGPEAIKRKMEAARAALRAVDRDDKVAVKQRLKELRREKRRKRRAEEGHGDDDEGDGAGEAVLGGASDDSDGGGGGGGYGSESESDGEPRVEAAHAGMLKKKADVGKMSLQEQEAMALRMLGGGGR